MNEWKYDATCKISALPVFDFETRRRFVFSVPWTNMHSFHRPMNTRIFSIKYDNHQISHSIFERYHMEKAATPVERIQRCGQLTINTFSNWWGNKWANYHRKFLNTGEKQCTSRKPHIYQCGWPIHWRVMTAAQWKGRIWPIICTEGANFLQFIPCKTLPKSCGCSTK